MRKSIWRMVKVKHLPIFLTAVFLAASIYNMVPENLLPKGALFDRIVVEKGKRRMHAYYQGRLLKTYKISLGFAPAGHKEFEGDGKTPEGEYVVNELNQLSWYHLNMGISYPNERDELHAEQQGKSPGGEIKIHGLKNGFGFIGKFHRLSDWTLGCIAVTNDEIEEIYRALPVGTAIEIKP